MVGFAVPEVGDGELAQSTGIGGQVRDGVSDHADPTGLPPDLAMASGSIPWRARNGGYSVSLWMRARRVTGVELTELVGGDRGVEDQQFQVCCGDVAPVGRRRPGLRLPQQSGPGARLHTGMVLSEPAIVPKRSCRIGNMLDFLDKLTASTKSLGIIPTIQR